MCIFFTRGTQEVEEGCVTVQGSVCSFCVRLCGWTRSLCLSALPSNRAPDEVIRTVTGVAGWRFCGALSDRFYSCGFLLSVSVFQVRRLFSPGRVSVFPEGWRLCTAGLLHLHCR